MFRTRGFIFRDTAVYAVVEYRTHSSTYYSSLPEDKPSGSKRVEDIKFKN